MWTLMTNIKVQHSNQVQAVQYATLNFTKTHSRKFSATIHLRPEDLTLPKLQYTSEATGVDTPALLLVRYIP